MAELSHIASLPRMTVEEFVVWSEQQPSGKYELVDGYVVVVRMQSEKIAHTRAKTRIVIAIDNALRKAAVPCEVFSEGITVKISSQHGYEPDALVNCGLDAPGDELIAPNPIIIVEVLSPSTAAKDMGTKVTDYFTVPTIQHYLIVDLDRRVVIHHRRHSAADLLTSFHSTGPIVLDPPGLTIDAEQMFG
jgi:Uma2 family endonuclease